MATHTMTLKQVINIEKSMTNYEAVGLDTYPIIPGFNRSALNDKIIDHYYNQEIGQETISMFRLAMRRRMNEIMPEMNQHYALSLLNVDPLLTMDVVNSSTMTGENTSHGTSSNESTSDAKSRAVVSETPQTSLQADADYASSMQDNVGKTDASGNATEDSNQTQNATTESTSKGYTGHAPQLILAARQAIVNVDMMVIDRLQDLFMLIWSIPDSYTDGGYYFDYLD